ncbi:MAG: 4'-phosphopantetheinyl transferase superfamily protein [Acetobacteraceae bacterium]|nr:4'-phosphopantetheinyl transferase superfamily protein [Acetobacteraceae bacterium]
MELTVRPQSPLVESGSFVTGAEAEVIHVRWLPMREMTGPAMARCLTLLDPDERARAGRFVFEEDRSAFIAAHALARVMLGALGRRDPASWRYVAGQHGKPEVAPWPGPAGLRFSLSHARTCVACVVGWNTDLGIDVEAERPQLSPVDLADRFFAPAEAAIIRAAPPLQTRAFFLALWTLKEAFIKATGEGLTRSLSSFSFSLSPPAITLEAGESDAPNWHFLQFRTEANHFIAVAARSPTARAVRFDARPAQPSELAVLAE